MRIPARALKPLVAMDIAAASFGGIVPAAYAENAAAAVISDDGGKMRSVSGKGTFVIPLLQRVDTLSLGAVQVQLTTENSVE